MNRFCGSSSEKDGVSISPSLVWITPSSLSAVLRQKTSQTLVLDMRPFTAFSVKHIETAQSLSFSPLLMRRMLTGAMSLDSLITDPQLITAMENASMIVLYDAASKPGNVKQELIRFSETLSARFSELDFNLKILSGK